MRPLPTQRRCAATYCGFALAAVLAGALFGDAVAQSVPNRSATKLQQPAKNAPVGSTSTGTATSPFAVPTAQDLTFRNLAAAPFHLTWQATQIRRSLDAGGRLIEVRERLTVQGTGAQDSPFQLEFVDLVGAVLTSAERQTWLSTYARHASLLFHHGGFAVHETALAEANYTLHDFGLTRRANREARRAVVFPRRFDKALWVVDVDTETGIPLYAGEYDSALRLVGEVEVVAFAFGAQVPRLAAGWNWTPRNQVDVHATPQLAMQQMQPGFVVAPALASILNEYSVHIAQVTTNRLNGDRSLVLGYTDGIDEFFVIEGANLSDPLANSPSRMPGLAQTKPHTIAAYDDPALRVYVFHEKGTTFQVAGSGTLARLKDAAYQLCHQAVTSN